MRQPSDWAKQNLRYTGYDLTQGEGARFWRECQDVARTLSLSTTTPAAVQEEIARYGDPVRIQPRLGQGIFRLAVTAAYSRACAVTGEHSLPALEAAHIRPYGQGGEHAVKNGLLLRSDLHRLFDRGYITVTPERRVEVSVRLKVDYNNGATYYPFHGKPVVVPRGSDEAPAAELLQWHNENVFRSR